MVSHKGEKSRSQVLSRLGRRAHDLVPAFLVTAAVLLIVEHWKHFDGADLTLLVLILASVAVHLFTRPFARDASQVEDLSETAGTRRPF